MSYWPEVPPGELRAGYHCPLCPCHQDDPPFFRVDGFPDPLCHPCVIELHHFAHQEFWSLLPCDQRLLFECERVTGIDWEELAQMLIAAEEQFQTA